MRANTKIRKGVAVFCAVLFLGVGVPAFSDLQSPVSDLTNAMDTFASSMSRSLPFNAGMGLNWSDAYIGRFFPSIPPRFGFGISGGFTTMDLDSFDGLLEMFGVAGDIAAMGNRLPLPGMMLEGRIGGFFLPFDVGVKIGHLPNWPGSFDMTHLIVGADIRYAVFEGNIILPTVSVGVGLNHLSGRVSRSTGNVGFGFEYDGANHVLDIAGPQMGLEWATNTLDFKVQVSRSILIITPYVGIGVSHGWSRVGYDLEGDVSGLAEAISSGLFAAIDIDDNSFRWERTVTGWSVRAFGGISFNIPLIRFDLTALWNMVDNNYGITMGVRFQI